MSEKMTREQARDTLRNAAWLGTNEDRERIERAVELLCGEPCEDEYIKVPKKALKYRTAGMVAYNAEWLKNHFDIERAVICGAQQPCDDAISRQAVISTIYDNKSDFKNDFAQGFFADRIRDLSPVTPKQRTGHWIAQDVHNCHTDFKCSECGYIHSFMHLYGKQTADYTYCPNCGCRMVEPQESEE